MGHRILATLWMVLLTAFMITNNATTSQVIFYATMFLFEVIVIRTENIEEVNHDKDN